MTHPTENPFGKFNGNEAEYALQMLSGEPAPGGISWPQALEEAFCETFGSSYAVACNSGTSGLHAALFAAGVGPGDEVIGPGLTVVMDAYAAILLGADPVFVDVDPDTFNLSPEAVRAAITPRTKAIIAVSLYGLPADMDAIMAIAAEHDLIVIEDTAQTVLATANGRMAGTLGHMGVFSLEMKKHMTSGSEGGMITTDDPDLATRARKFAGIGYKHMTARAGRTHLALATVQNPEYERFDTIGLNYRINELSAAVGLGQLERIDGLVANRVAVANLFAEAVRGCAWMVPQHVPAGTTHSYFTYPVKYFGAEQRGMSWRKFYERYREKGGDGFYAAWINPHLEPALRGRRYAGITLEKGLCPVAEDLQGRMMQFKTNYRNRADAKRNAAILGALVDEIGR